MSNAKRKFHERKALVYGLAIGLVLIAIAGEFYLTVIGKSGWTEVMGFPVPKFGGFVGALAFGLASYPSIRKKFFDNPRTVDTVPPDQRPKPKAP